MGEKMEEEWLHIEGLDMLDQTTLLDIKPPGPGFNPSGVERVGWLSGMRGDVRTKKSDERFR